MSYMEAEPGEEELMRELLGEKSSVFVPIGVLRDNLISNSFSNPLDGYTHGKNTKSHVWRCMVCLTAVTVEAP